MILYRYIARELIRPFFIATMVIVALFTMQMAMNLLPRIMHKGVPPEIIVELFAVNMVSILVIAMPMALLLSVLSAFGRLSADSEIVAMKSGGYSIGTFIPPVALLASVIGITLVLITNTILPDANYRASLLFRDIIRTKPAAMIDAGVLMTDFPGYAMIAEEVNHSTGELTSITIFAEQQSGPPSFTQAQRGTLFLTHDEEYIELTLYNGETHHSGEGESHFRVSFEMQQIFFKNIESGLNRTTEKQRSDREKSAQMLSDEIAQLRHQRDSLGATHSNRIESLRELLVEQPEEPLDGSSTFEEWRETFLSNRRAIRPRPAISAELHSTRSIIERRDALTRTINEYRVEWHKKYALGAAALVFALLGVPLGIIAKNGSAALAAGYSLIFYIIYYVFLIGGEFLGDRNIVPPPLAMWSGNLFIGSITIYLIYLSMTGQGRALHTPIFELFKKIPALFKPIKRRVAWRMPRQSKRARAQISPRLIEGYILKNFIATFLPVFIGLTVLTIVIDYISNMQNLSNAKGGELLEYYAIFFAGFLTILMPITLLLSTMLSLGAMGKQSELVAIKASGKSMTRATAPLMIIGLLLSYGVFEVTERILPTANERILELREIFNARRNNIPPPQNGSQLYRYNLYYFHSPEEIFHFRHFQQRGDASARADQVTRFRLKNGELKTICHGRTLSWGESEWRFINGTTRLFEKSGEGSLTRFSDTALYDFTPHPEEIAQKVPSVARMSFGQLREHIEQETRQGKSTRHLKADLLFKLALPLMNVIVILIGIGFGAKSTHRGGAVQFGKGLGIVVAYWAVAQTMLFLGQAGKIAPFPAAWAATIFFFFYGLFLYKGASR